MAPPIVLAFETETLETLCAEYKLPIAEFETIVIAQISAFLRNNRNKVNKCVVVMSNDCGVAAYSQTATPMDQVLEDAITQHSLDLAQSGWFSIEPTALFGDPDLERLEDFAQFSLDALLQQD